MSQYLLLALGGMLFGAMVYRYDMHEREPWWMLLLCIASGAGMMAIAFVLETQALVLALQLDPGRDLNLLHALLAGTLEELAKVAVPVAVLLGVRKYFNDPMDGLIYGSMAGLGAAMYEAVWWQIYQPTNPEDTAAVLASGGTNAIRIMMHTMWGGSAGFALGLIVRKQPWRLTFMQGLGWVMALHAGWDYFVGFVENQTAIQRLIATGILGGSIVWFGMQVVQANKWSREMHAPSSKKRLVGRVIKAILTRRFK